MRTQRVMWPMLGLAVVGLLLGLGQGNAAMVLMMSTSNATLDALTKSTMESFGHQVDVGPQYINFDGTTDLSPYNAVLLLPNVNWNSGNMPTAGQNALKDFVNSGGGLVTSEWLVWKRAAQGSFTDLFDAIPVVASSGFAGGSPITYTVVTADAILNDGVASPFTFTADSIGGTETFFAPKDGATSYYSSSGSAGGDGLIGWDFGLGRTISFSTLIGTNELNDSNYSQLVSNAITWSTNPQGRTVVNPEPGSLTLLGLSTLGLLAYAWRRKCTA